MMLTNDLLRSFKCGCACPKFNQSCAQLRKGAAAIVLQIRPCSVIGLQTECGFWLLVSSANWQRISTLQ